MLPLVDYSTLPTYPAPWKELPCVPGFSVCGYANLPKSKTQAADWASKVLKSGCRVYRIHKVDVPLRDNPTSHIPRLQWLLDALKKRGIPCLMEVLADTDDFDAALTILSRLDLSNVVGICPVNEPQYPYDFQGCYQAIRAIGFEGFIFGSNSVIQGGSAGDLLDAHVYCGLEGQASNEYFEIEYKYQPWNHPKVVDIATELGHLWPATTRGRSEEQIVDVLFKAGCKAFLMFAFIDRPEQWNIGTVSNKDHFCDDPTRMETWRRLVQRCVGPSINLTANVKGELVKDGKWRVVVAS